MAVTNRHTVNGKLIGETSSGQRTRDLTDALGSVTGTADSTGAIVNTYRYKAYGARLAKTGSGGDPKFLWTGDTGSRATGLAYSGQYNRARHYAAEVGLWTAVDEAWWEESPYSFASARPSSAVDPSGRSAGGCQARVRATVESSPNQCIARCHKDWWDCPSWFEKKCSFHMQTDFVLRFWPGTCTGCKVYQWVEILGDMSCGWQTFRPGWQRDDGLGWPYPSQCNTDGAGRTFCVMTDSPFDDCSILGCGDWVRLRRYVTCLCCNGFSKCFWWTAFHDVTRCRAECGSTISTLDDQTSRTLCQND